MTIQAGGCCAGECQGRPTSPDDVFCPEHWRQLPRWARTSLVALRNDSRRGGRQAADEFLRGAAVCAHLLKPKALNA